MIERLGKCTDRVLIQFLTRRPHACKSPSASFDRDRQLSVAPLPRGIVLPFDFDDRVHCARALMLILVESFSNR